MTSWIAQLMTLDQQQSSPPDPDDSESLEQVCRRAPTGKLAWHPAQGLTSLTICLTVHDPSLVLPQLHVLFHVQLLLHFPLPSGLAQHCGLWPLWPLAVLGSGGQQLVLDGLLLTELACLKVAEASHVSVP